MLNDEDFRDEKNPFANTKHSPDEPDHLLGQPPRESGLDFLTSIWLSPRETIRRILNFNPELYVIALACLAGIGEALNRASLRNAGDEMPLAVILVIACLLGPLGGLFSLWMSSHLVRFSGSWIGGIAPREHIKTAIAWSSVPSVFGLVFWIPNLLLLGPDLFTKEMPRVEAEPNLLYAMMAISFAEIVIGIWSIVLLCNTIAEVQGYGSAWKGLWNLFLAGLAIIVPLIAIVFVVMFLSAA